MIWWKPAAILTAVAAIGCSTAQGAPLRVGGCAVTTIKSVETRLQDGQTNRPIAGSGSTVSFGNGLYQVSYDTVRAIEQSRRGDRVRICLVAVPKNCPRGDDRGKIYATTNLRTGGRWRLPRFRAQLRRRLK